MTDETRQENEALEVVQSENQTVAPEIPVQETSAEPPKKRRGRPPKNPSLIQEGIPGGQSSTASAKPKKNKAAYDVANLGKQITGLHAMAAMVTGIPELQINDAEGLMLAGGVISVAEQYDLSIDGKTGAALQLLAAAAMVYAPRVLAINARAKKAREANAETVPFTELTPNVSPS